MLVAFNRLFFAGSGGCAVLLAGWQKTPIGGLAAWVQHGIRGPIGGFSVAFGASPLLFELFLRLRDASRGPIVAFSASQGRKRCSGAPWRRFLPRNCCLLGSIRRECFRPSEGESSPPVVRIVASGPRILALVSAKYHLCVRGPSCSKAFLCRFVANTCGFLVRVHGVR